MSAGPRYGRIESIVRLALDLAGTVGGRTIPEIAADHGVSRRTAERMRDAVERAVPGLEIANPGERERRWRIRGAALSRAVAVTAEEVAAVEGAAARLEEEGAAERATALRSAAAKLRAAAVRDALRRAEPDVEALLEAEGMAARPGPRVVLPEGVLPLLRGAILGARAVRLRYRGADGAARERVVHPYGLLYGARPYLVAPVPGKPAPALWRLDRVLGAEETGEGFARPADFDLRGFAARSFGVFQEQALDVTLRFAPGAAEEAAAWRFHPTQVSEVEADGSLLVRFRAGGVREMCWHLFTWGEAVEVVSPSELRDALTGMAAGVAARHTREEKGE